MIQKNDTRLSAPNQSTSHSISLLRLVGYVMIILFILDIAVLFYPLQLMDPNWEFQTMGNTIERIVIPLMGLAFIFWGETQARNKWELFFLNGLSWATLGMAIICLFVIPLVLVTSSQRLVVQIDTNFGNEFDRQISQAEAIQEQIEAAERNEIEAFLENQGVDSSPQNAREQLLDELATAKNQVRTEIQNEINARKELVKENAVKWILGSIISGILFFYIWRLTRWARVIPKNLFGRKSILLK